MSELGGCVPSPVAAHKRSYCVVKENLHSNATDVIDLCSPVHTKPCRQQTPVVMKDNSVGCSLFGVMDCDGEAAAVDSPQNTAEAEDPYWQPPGYSGTPTARNDASHLEPEECNSSLVEDEQLFAAAGSFISRHLHSNGRDDTQSPGVGSISSDHAPLDDPATAPAHINTLTVQTKAPVMDVIDLCSPVSVICSSSALPSTHAAKQGFTMESIAAVEMSTSTRHVSDSKNTEITHTSHKVRVTESFVDFTADIDGDSPVDSDSEESGRASYCDPVGGTDLHRSTSNLAVLSVESSTQQSFASSRQSSVLAVEHASYQRYSSSSAAHTTQPRSLFSMVTSGPTLREYASHESQNSTLSHTTAALAVAGSSGSDVNTTAAPAKPVGSLHQILLTAQQQVEGKLLAEKQSMTTTAINPAAAPKIATTSTRTAVAGEEPHLQRTVSLPSSTKAPKKSAPKAVSKNSVTATPALAQPMAVAPSPAVAPAGTTSLRRATSVQTSTSAVRVDTSLTLATGASSHVAPGAQTSGAVHCVALPRKVVQSTSTSGAPATATSTSSGPTSSSGAGGGRADLTAAPKFRSRFTEKTLSPLPTLPADTHWEVMLLIDKRERSNAQIQSSMAARNIPCQLATLAVGDFLWVARIRTNNGTAQVGTSIPGASNMTAPIASATGGNGTTLQALMPDEDTQMSATSDLGDLGDEEIEDCDNFTTFVLDCIAERKSISDMASSMCDGRYNEQKNRLRACALRSTMYIVEGEHIVLSMHQKAISAAHIKTAMVSIHVSA